MSDEGDAGSSFLGKVHTHKRSREDEEEDDTLNTSNRSVMSLSVVNNFTYEPFVSPGTEGDIYKTWHDWHEGLVHILEASNIPDGKKFSSLLAYGGKELRSIYSMINNGTIPKNEDFDTAIEKLESHFKPKQHATYLRVKFWELTKESDESIDDFVQRMNDRKRHCNFGKSKEEIEDFVMTDKFIMSMPQNVKQELMRDRNLTFESAVRQAKEIESSRNQARELSTSSLKEKPFMGSINRLKERPSTSSMTCYRCNSRNHLADSSRCPARNEKCHECGRRGHFANTKFCNGPTGKSKERNNQRYAVRFKDESRSRDEPRSKKRKIQEFRHIDDEREEIEEFSYVSGTSVKVICQVGKFFVKMLVDSGTNRNVIDENTWLAMLAKGFRPKLIKETKKVKLLAYGNVPLKQIAIFEAEIKANVNGKYQRELARFVVIENGSQPLLSKGTAEALGILSITLTEETKEDLETVNAVVVESRKKPTLPKRRNKVPFPKIKDVVIHLTVKPDVKPVQLMWRRVPIALTKAVEEKLLELEQNDIIERVYEPSPWMSPLVVVRKNNGELRLCVDLRRLNKAIERERHPLPTFKEMMTYLSQAKFFSLLDIKSAYHQCELDTESRPLTTFMTQWGMFRYKRLVFGVSCAPEKFQKVMEAVLSGCKNVIIYIDDILIYGKTSEEHDECVKKVMKKLEDQGVMLNSEKCKIKKEKIIFLGHEISSKGIYPTIDKINAINQFRAPKDKTELKSFLGLVCYVAKFIPDLATITAPLRKLLKMNAVFDWQEEQETAFETIKKFMANPTRLGYFDVKKRTRLIVDASPVGLGAVLLQIDDDGEVTVIQYCAKSLTETEKRYCQPEREALAVVWGVEYCEHYLLGITFELVTDHQSLVKIFGEHSRPCARIERWVLRLQAFNYVIIHEPGATNIADALSRLPIRKDLAFDEESDAYINAILTSAAVDIEEIESVTRRDEKLQLLKEAIDNGDFDREELREFKFCQQELSYVGDIIMRGKQIVVPKELQKRFLELAHEGHLGKEMMKRRLRARCWFPKIDEETERFVKECRDCLLVSAPVPPEPMSRKRLPDRPFCDIAIDFLGPLPSGEFLLVVVDYFSRWMDVKIMRKITSQATIEKLEEIFFYVGYPNTITLDNGRQFISNEFHDYCHFHKIKLNHTAPYWPQANGEVERQNRTLLRRLKIGAHKGDYKTELRTFLVAYNSTPHSVTNVSPNTLMGREKRSKIPMLADIEVAPTKDMIVERDYELKKKGKEHEDAKRGAQVSDVKVGDVVLQKNMLKENKLTTDFNEKEFVIVEKNGPVVTVQNPETGERYNRNVAHVKKVPVVVERPNRPRRNVGKPVRYSD